MVVTDIIPIDSKKKRVCIDYDYVFPLYLSEIKKFHLAPDTEISEQSFATIRELLSSRLQERILYYITDCDHSERDIKRKMLQAYYPEDLVDEVIDKLKALKYIDDSRYASYYAESLHHSGKGASYIRNKLYEKGISRDLIEEVLSKDLYHEDETELILKELKKKGITPEQIPGLEAKERNRLQQMLLRKGFKSSDILKLIPYIVGPY